MWQLSRLVSTRITQQWQNEELVVTHGTVCWPLPLSHILYITMHPGLLDSISANTDMIHTTVPYAQSTIAQYTGRDAECDQQPVIDVDCRSHLPLWPLPSYRRWWLVCRDQILQVPSPEFGTKVHGEVPLFLDTLISLKYSVAWIKGNLYTKIQLDPCNHFNTIPACDKTDTERYDDS